MTDKNTTEEQAKIEEMAKRIAADLGLDINDVRIHKVTADNIDDAKGQLNELLDKMSTPPMTDEEFANIMADVEMEGAKAMRQFGLAVNEALRQASIKDRRIMRMLPHPSEVIASLIGVSMARLAMAIADTHKCPPLTISSHMQEALVSGILELDRVKKEDAPKTDN